MAEAAAHTVPLRVVIVDDEALARRGLRDLCAGDAAFQVVEECPSGTAAVEAIRALRPDLVLLDIQMPEMSGFDVMRALGDAMPATIIVTAFDQHAIRAFEHHAIDYLLKPVAPDRFAAALRRAGEWVRRADAARQAAGVRRLLAELEGDVRAPGRIAIQTQRSMLYLEPHELHWVEAAGNYLRFHVGGDVYLVRSTLQRVEGMLDPRLFLRIHRSTIVNVQQVREVVATSSGSDVRVILRDDTTLAVGRTYKEAVSRL